MSHSGRTTTANAHLDPWSTSYAARAAGLAESSVRALFAVASRPEVVSLAGGMPNVSALPEDLVSDAVTGVLRDHGPAALQYGSGQGVERLREQVTEVMSLSGVAAGPEDVVMTTGSQHALDLLAKLLVDPGDVVLAEGPSYVTALVVFRSYQAQVEQIGMDADGLVPELLRERIARMRAEGRRIKALYTVPTFHNPSGVTLTGERRAEILGIAHENGILVIEDDPYGLLHFSGRPPAALRSLDADGVVYLGTFSKTLAPGFRLGWALAPRSIREKLVLANEAAVLCPSSFNQLVVSRYLGSTDWRAQIDVFRASYRDRKEAMIAALEEHLPGCAWTDPDGGFYVWLTLPAGVDSRAMLPRAVEALVAYTPGTAFYVDGSGADRIRLSFCHPTPERIRLGIQRLASVVDVSRETAAIA